MTQWQNFLRNRGEWRGSFTQLDDQGRELDTTPSILTLQSEDNDTLVRFRLRRFADGKDAPPTQDLQQEYRTLGRQVVFFSTGAFSKGSLQVAPFTRFGAEYGFVAPDRRLRLVQLYSESGRFASMVLIREFRSGSAARERPPLEVEHLIGTWRGEFATITADWPEPSLQASLTRVERTAPDRLRITTEAGDDHHSREGVVEGRVIECAGETPRRIHLLADGAASDVPLQVDHRHPFHVEASWMVSPRERQSLVRRYDGTGRWICSSHRVEYREES
ncbi:MAG: DUF3598 family protein [Synechococcaceae cyanobacterium]|nr:DUF3598 family protein [Synechococcaceae cyanobacterium]